MGRVLRLINGIARHVDEASALTIYDQLYTVPVGGITTGSPITLPAAQTYTAEELEVYFNGVRAKVSSDYNYVGVAPRTQISFAFDLLANEQIRFRIDRPA